jgi:hypothetical protein
VMLLTQRLLRAAWPVCDSSDRASRHPIDYWSMGIAAAWALHPLQVSTVMYVVQRMEMLCFTFVLLSLLTYWHARQQQLAGRRAWPWLVLAAAFIAAGYSFKETAILVPGYTMLIELMLLHFSAARQTIARTWKVFYAIGYIAAITFIALYVMPHYADPSYYAARDFNAWQRELTQLRVLPLYLGWSALPLPSHLQFYYDNYAASTSLLQPLTTLFGGLFLLGLLALAIFMRHRRPLFALGIGWFFVAHAITSAPLSLELVFEHRNYPALLGALLAAADMAWWLSHRSNSRVVVIIAGILVLNLAFLTALRAATWGSPLRLAMTLSEINPDSTRAALDLARRYMAMSGGDSNSPLFSLSVKELERASRLPRDSIMPEEALLLTAADHPDMPTRPLIPDTYAVLRQLMTQVTTGHPGIDAQQLAKCYAIAVARDPARQSLHVEYAELAGASLHTPELASEQWRLALQLDTDVQQYAPRLAGYLIDEHRPQEALAVISQAMETQPTLRSDQKMKDLQMRARLMLANTSTPAK